MTKYQIKTLDTLVREVVFARDGHRCRKCEKKEGLAPSHIYPKGRYRRMRWEPLNILTLCVVCHMFFWHKNPIEAWEWLKDNLDAKTLKWLKLRTQVNESRPMDYQLIKLDLEEQLKPII